MDKKVANLLNAEDIKEIVKTTNGMITPDTDIMHEFPTEESLFKAVLKEIRKNAK